MLEAGLPNITGRLVTGIGIAPEGTHSVPEGYYNKSALLPSADAAPIESWTTGGTETGNFDFNASRSNTTYGKSSTVQPPAIKLVPQIKF